MVTGGMAVEGVAGSVEGRWRGMARKEERQEIGVALVGCKMLTQHDGWVAPLTVELGPGGTALLVVLNLLHSSHSSCGTRRVTYTLENEFERM